MTFVFELRKLTLSGLVDITLNLWPVDWLINVMLLDVKLVMALNRMD